ncbi:MAG: molybdopterin molybdotransferase MoeA [bacterium]
MISVEQAFDILLQDIATNESETVAISDVVDRIAAKDINAQITQPPFSASAMDGYAVQFGEAKENAILTVIGESPAGSPFLGTVGKGQAVHIFTGGVVPDGADHIIIQEHTDRTDNQIRITQPQVKPSHIRPAGVDFNKGDKIVSKGTLLHDLHPSLLAAANIASISVIRRPIIALFSNGDELREPGSALKPGQIINSNHFALTNMVQRWGGEPQYLGCAADSKESLKHYFEKAMTADIIIPIGGASVGDYDYLRPSFQEMGGDVIFEKIAVRPGKPTWYGRMGRTRIIGLPGNPASALVTAALFVQPVIRALSGLKNTFTDRHHLAKLTDPLPANGPREAYLRGIAQRDEKGELTVTPFPNQDSSLLRPFATANVLIQRSAHAQAANPGETTAIVWLR